MTVGVRLATPQELRPYNPSQPCSIPWGQSTCRIRLKTPTISATMTTATKPDSSRLSPGLEPQVGEGEQRHRDLEAHEPDHPEKNENPGEDVDHAPPRHGGRHVGIQWGVAETRRGGRRLRALPPALAYEQHHHKDQAGNGDGQNERPAVNRPRRGGKDGRDKQSGHEEIQPVSDPKLHGVPLDHVIFRGPSRPVSPEPTRRQRWRPWPGTATPPPAGRASRNRRRRGLK